MTEVLRFLLTLQHGDGPARFTALKIMKTEVYCICKTKICHVFQQLRGYSDDFVLLSLWHGKYHLRFNRIYAGFLNWKHCQLTCISLTQKG